MIFNTHSHINDKLENLNELVDECLDSNVDKIAVVGYDLSSSLRAIKACKHPNVYAIVGLQPNEVSSFDGNYDAFIDLFNNEKCIGIGEIGLDYYWNKDEKENQMKAFEKQLQMASNYKKPVIIHCRDAYEDTFNMLSKYHKQLDGIIMHCYSGSVEMMRRFLTINCYISISGVVTFKNAKAIKEVAKEVPLDRLLVETDDPYLTPVPFRGKENRPSYVKYVLKEIAEIKKMNYEELEKIVYENSLRVFHL